jgi:hypothetical protein
VFKIERLKSKSEGVVNLVMLFIVIFVGFYIWMIVYAINNAKKAYPGAISSTSTSAPAPKSQKTVINGDWEGGRPLPHRKYFKLFGDGMVEPGIEGHDVGNGYDGITFDYDA